MPPAKMRGDGRKAKDPKKTLLRLLSYLKNHVGVLTIVMLCIVAAAIAQTQSSTALGKLVDRFILPMVSTGSTDFGPLKEFLTQLVGIFLIGIVANFLQSYLMVGVTQGIQKEVRDELFTKMQKLPIRYFDTNTAGNIMSRYTSDIDTLRQMISQSIPQAVSSVVTLIAVLIALAWGVASLVRIIWNAAAAEIPDVSTSTPIVVERPIISTTSAPAATATPAARYTLTAEERDTVERVVMAEAGGESFEGKMLVAQCILTATEKTGLQPSEVVVKYKYTASRPEPSQSVKDAVAAVFDRGELVVDEPVMYFYNPAIVESEWHESQIFVIEVGGHRFFAERSQNNER